jgi:putative phosphoesterase
VKIVIISDIHGNLEALTSLRETFDELWVLGDLVNYGPNPAEVVEFVREKASIAISGNHDHAIGFGDDPRCSPPFREMAAVMGDYTASVLSDSQKQFLRNLPVKAEREVHGMRVSLCHAMPSDPLFGYCPPESDDWGQEVELAGADMLFVGHTHLQFSRQFRTRRLVNPGSLGQPKMRLPAACYATWDGGRVELKTVEYPFEDTIRKIDALSIPSKVKASLADVLRNGGPPAVPSSESKEKK